MAKVVRNTKQRQLILDLLKGTTCHPTADWVYQRVREEIPNVSLGTVYRNLGVLKDNQVIQELRHAGGQSRYDGNPRPHYHFFCLGCDKVDDMPMDYNQYIDEEFAKKMPQHTLQGHSTYFYGFCPQCETDKRRRADMAVFVCGECGAEREGRCKPRKCAQCGAASSFEKKE